MNENWLYIKENIKHFPEYKSSIFEQGFLITNQNLTIGGAFPFFRTAFISGFTVGKSYTPWKRMGLLTF